MHSLKNALGKDSESDELSVSVGNPSKTFSKSKNGSMWTLDPEQDDEQQKMKDSNLKRLKQFQLKIKNAFQKDSTFSEIIFFQIIEQIQSISEEIDELARLQLIEKAAIKINETPQQSLKVFTTSFLECLVRRIKKLKKKQKKTELQEYDKIVKTNFKKKSGAQFIDEADFDNKETATKNIRNNGINNRSNNKTQNSSSKRNGSASSNEGKLTKLISSGTLREQKKQEENEQAQNQHEESVSFAAVVSQSMVVRQRKPKEQKNKKQKEQVPKLQQKQSEGTDEAFIFYRPKVGKKK